MKSDLISDVRRWRATAETWFEKAAYIIRRLGEHESESVRAVAGWEAARLLGKVLHNAEVLVPLIEEDLIEDVERKAKQLASALRAHRLAFKLDETAGRTPAEVAAFKQKAATLRSQPASRG